jgi:hypothetical protein
MACLVCNLRGMCNCIIGLSSLCLLLNVAAAVGEVVAIASLELLLFVLVLRLLYKFKEPVRAYRRCLLPFTAFELFVQVSSAIV